MSVVVHHRHGLLGGRHGPHSVLISLTCGVHIISSAAPHQLVLWTPLSS